MLAFLAAIAMLLSESAPGVAYVVGSDVVVFQDACDGRMYAINPDGSGRHVLPDVGGGVRDVSRGSTRVTVLALGRSTIAEPSSPLTLYAVDPSPGGSLPVNLLQPTDPTPFWDAVFSPDGGRIAYTHSDPVTNRLELYIGDVVRDAVTNQVAGLTNITLSVVNLLAIGQRSDSNSSGPSTGSLDFSRDGHSLVAVIYDDLWKLELAPDGHTFAAPASPLTRTKDAAELYPRWSPTSDVIAYAGGPFSTSFGFTALALQDMNIYTLVVGTGAIKRVTTSKNGGGSGDGKNSPTWSPDAVSLLYSAQGQSAFGKRNLPCSPLVNYDLFRIPADGSAKAVNVTNTAGTGVEGIPRWGWR